MTYYDLLKQYVLTGYPLTEYQFNRIKEDGQLLNSYFYSRGKVISYNNLEDYEVNFLSENPKYLVRLGKDALIYYRLYRKGVLRKDIMDILLSNFVNLLTSWDVNTLIGDDDIYRDELDDDDIYRDELDNDEIKREFFRVLYGKRPEIFNTLVSRIWLYKRGITDCSDEGNIGGKFKIDIWKRDIYELFGNGRDNRDIIYEYLSWDDKDLGSYFYIPDRDWKDIVKEYIDEDNKRRISEYLSSFFNRDFSDIDRLISVINNNSNDKLRNLRMVIRRSIRNTDFTTFYDGLSDSIIGGLSYYGEMDAGDEYKIELTIDMGELMKKSGIDKFVNVCHFSNANEYFMNFVAWLPIDKKPMVIILDRVDFDGDIFNKALREIFKR